MVALLAAGLVLFALLMASYSRRSTWVALGSAVFSLGAVIGFLFLSTTPQSGQIRAALAELAKELPAGLDESVTDLAAAIDRTAKALSCEDGKRPICNMLARAAAPAPATPEPVATAPVPVQAGTTASWLDTKAAPKRAGPYPIAWRLDEPSSQVVSTDSGAFVLSGTNVSDQPLEKVRAVLKPDSGAGEVDLALTVEGLDGVGGAIIPPGAGFSLVAPVPSGPAELGGAILSFSYIQDGQRRTSIRYLTPAMVARSAEGPTAAVQPGQ